jgi:hypothetical protein
MTMSRAEAGKLAAIKAMPDQGATVESPTQGRIRGMLSAAVAAGAGAAAVRTLVRQIAKRSLGPFGLVISAFQAVIAVRAATRALARWRADRRLRRSEGFVTGR